MISKLQPSLNDVYLGKACCKGVSGCYCKMGIIPKKDRCPECRDKPEGDGGNRRYSACVCPPKELCPDLAEEEINDKIDAWHESDSELELHEWLGMTWDEYNTFLKGRK